MNLVEAITQYEMPERAKQLIIEHPSLNIAGPSGAGKGTVTQYLMQTGNYGPIVSDTTREPRRFANGYEVNGVQYWFIDEQTAIDKLSNGAYIEAKSVHGDTLYGTSIAAYESVVESGRIPVLEIDVQGMEELMDKAPGFEAIFLLPPSFSVWEERLDGRGDMDIEQKIRRFGTAVVEYDKALQHPSFYPVINNEVLETAEVIKSGAYRESEYYDRALEVARNLKVETEKFLAEHRR